MFLYQLKSLLTSKFDNDVTDNPASWFHQIETTMAFSRLRKQSAHTKQTKNLQPVSMCI